MLTGILVPTSGSLVVNGLVPYERRQQNARNIGVVFGQRTQLWWDIPVVESFNLARDMYEIPAKRYRENLAQFTELLGLDEFMNLPAGKISLGQRMRADLCMALLHDPKTLYLDEPTIGLDIAVKDSIRQASCAAVVGRARDHCHAHDPRPRRHRGHLQPDRDHRQRQDHPRRRPRALKDTYARDRVIHFQLARLPESIAAIRAGLPTSDLTTDGLRLSVRFDRFRVHRRRDRRGGDAPRRSHRLPHRRARSRGPDPEGLPRPAEPHLARRAAAGRRTAGA